MTLREIDLASWLSEDTRPERGEEFLLGGRVHTFVGPLGEGTFGKTFHVSVRDGADLVFKVFKNPSASVAKEIKKEFERAKSIDSPYCAKMQFLLRDRENICGFSYEFLEGSTLESLIVTSDVKFSPEEIRQLCLGLLRALESLHMERWVHKDIKPANVIVLTDNRGVNLIDFGLLTPVGHGTRAGAGTPEYMAPEAHEALNASPQFDLYGACASILELIVGRTTFESCFTRPTPSNRHVFNGLAAADLAHLSPLSRNLARQLAKGLAPDPLDRPRSVSDLIELVIQTSSDPEPEGVEVRSTAVDGLLQLRKGSPGVLPQESEFSRLTQVDTQLYRELVPRLLEGEFDAVFLSGNPGDGKTTFLNFLYDVLVKLGGVISEHSDTGWVVEKSGRVFHAMLDASESDGDVSSDERIAALLGELSRPGHIVLLAINDGRIDSFMRSHSDEFGIAVDVQHQLRGREPRNPRIVVIDLKRRTLIRQDGDNGGGLGVQILRALTESDLWAECENCVSREVCPILDNKTRIRKDAALESVEKLLAISHYRLEQRATFRDIRSVFSYLITGDKDCDEVHAARRDGRDLRRASGLMFFDLAFSGPDGEHLFESWKILDPARLPLAAVSRRVISRSRPDTTAADQRTIASFAREAFFGANQNWLGSLDESDLNVYRFFDQYRETLRGESTGLLPRILRGLSRILGAQTPTSETLSITMSDRAESWKVQREFDRASFNIEVDHVHGGLVEVAADSLRLVYRSPTASDATDRVAILLSLDDVELILRADAGEVFNDIYSKSVIAKFMGFASRLRLRETNTVTIVGPSDEMVKAELTETQIRLTSV